MIKVTFDTYYSGKETVIIRKGRYANNSNTALVAICTDPEGYGATWGYICKSWN